MNINKETVVLITGASRGIGAATAKAFATTGCKLALTYNKDKEKMDAVAEACRAAGSEVYTHQLNLRDEASINVCIEGVIQEYNALDLLINNAGVVVRKPLEKQTAEDIALQTEINLQGLIYLTSKALPHVKGVINIASEVARKTFDISELLVYASTKFGVLGFSQLLTANYPNVFACSVNPGLTATDMTGHRGIPPKKVADVILKTALGDITPDKERSVDVWDHV